MAHIRTSPINRTRNFRDLMCAEIDCPTEWMQQSLRQVVMAECCSSVPSLLGDDHGMQVQHSNSKTRTMHWQWHNLCPRLVQTCQCHRGL